MLLTYNSARRERQSIKVVTGNPTRVFKVDREVAEHSTKMEQRLNHPGRRILHMPHVKPANFRLLIKSLKKDRVETTEDGNEACVLQLADEWILAKKMGLKKTLLAIMFKMLDDFPIIDTLHDTFFRAAERIYSSGAADETFRFYFHRTARSILALPHPAGVLGTVALLLRKGGRIAEDLFTVQAEAARMAKAEMKTMKQAMEATKRVMEASKRRADATKREMQALKSKTNMTRRELDAANRNARQQETQIEALKAALHNLKDEGPRVTQAPPRPQEPITPQSQEMPRIGRASRGHAGPFAESDSPLHRRVGANDRNNRSTIQHVIDLETDEMDDSMYELPPLDFGSEPNEEV